MDGKSLISILQMMLEGKLASNLTGVTGLLVVLAGLCIFILVNGDHQKGLFGYLQARNRAKVEQLEKYLSNSDSADLDCLRELRDIYDAEVFASYTGIYAEKAKRAELIWLHKRIGKHPSWRLIKTIHDSIEFDDLGKVFLKPYTPFRRYLMESLKIVAGVLFIMGQIAWMLVFYSSNNKVEGTLVAVIIYTVTIYACVRIALNYARQRSVMEAAETLKDESRATVATDQIEPHSDNSIDRNSVNVIEVQAAG